MNEELYNFFAEYLPSIDNKYAQQRIVINQRPLRASIFFCENFLVTVEGDTTENYSSKPWFSAILKEIERWYRNRYGEAFDNRKDENINGVIFIYNYPFKLTFPKNIYRDLADESIFEVRFLDEVLEEENAFDWLVEKPDLGNNSQLAEIEKDIKRIASFSRLISINLMTDFPTPEIAIMASSIFTHINDGIQNIIYGWQKDETIFVWDFHLAIEKSMKVYLQQRGIKSKNTHSLFELNRIDGEIINSKFIDKLPSHAEAIKHRYGEGCKLNEQKIMDIYLSYLEAISECVKKYKRKFYMGKASVGFKKPSWKI